MDIILGLLQQLATSLSPTQFLGVLALVVTSVFMTFKVLSARKKKGKGLIGFLTGAPAGLTEEQLLLDLQVTVGNIEKLMNTVATSGTVERQTDKVLQAIAEVKQFVVLAEDHLDAQLVNIESIKNDLHELAEDIIKELSDIKHNLKMHDVQTHQDAEITKELQNRMHGILGRMISQVEKLDEFAKAVVPEFRSHSKDLSKDISGLSRDIALVERSIQNQINTPSSIKLR
jgi:hypothetical protein